MKRYDDDLEIDEKTGTGNEEKKNLYKLVVIAVALLAVLAVVVFFVFSKQNKQDAVDAEPEVHTEVMAEAESSIGTESGAFDKEDPQDILNTTEMGEEVDVAELLSASNIAETDEITCGIDVAKYQGVIDWAKVAGAGIDFAMVRVGYRTMETGEICEDSTAKYNMQEAQANGVKIGAYFFSTAVTKEEAIEEADWVADYIAQYRITYPVAYNCEGFNNIDNRQYSLTQTERSDIAMAFLNRIYERGYTPMFYAPRNELVSNTKWDTDRIEERYKVWVSHYTSAETTDYTGQYVMWQYTNQGTIDGIDTPVDVNIAYFGYEGTAAALDQTAPETVEANVEALMNFQEVNETVTAKNETNLRDIPCQGEESTVILTLKNGDTATRTGVSNSGWSRVEYGGQVYYAVSSYLTTDLSAPVQTSSEDTGDGLKTKFADCSDIVTAKIEVNLRTLPSVTNPESTVVAVLHNGETVTRTGVNNEYGWSRVDYNGQTLYCVSSYLQSAQ